MECARAGWACIQVDNDGRPEMELWGAVPAAWPQASQVGEAIAGGESGRPRSLDFGDGIEAQPLKALEDPTETGDELENNNDLDEEKSRRRRSPRDAAGNRVLNVRVRRETEEEVEEADIQTERIIQVRRTF